jgi:hypothetical protein
MSLSLEFIDTLPATIIAPKPLAPQALAAPEPTPTLTHEPEVEISLDQVVIPVSNAVTATLYQQWHICAHKYTMELREVMEEAMKAYFKTKLTPGDKLPPKKQTKVTKKIATEREKQRDKWV